MKKQKQKDFGSFLRERRLELQIGLREFARIVGVSATYIYQVEFGKCSLPHEDVIMKMAYILKLNGDELLAKAGKIAPDLQEIIRDNPEIYSSFLRKVKLSEIKRILYDSIWWR